MCLYPSLKLFSIWCVKRVEASIRTGHEERFDSDDMHRRHSIKVTITNSEWSVYMWNTLNPESFICLLRQECCLWWHAWPVTTEVHLTYPALWSAPRRASLKILGTDFSRGSYQFQIADISLYSNHYLFAGSEISGHKWQPQILSIFWCPKVFYASNPSEAWCWCAKIIYLIIYGGSSCHVRSKIMSLLSYELLMLSLKGYFGVYFPSCFATLGKTPK